MSLLYPGSAYDGSSAVLHRPHPLDPTSLTHSPTFLTDTPMLSLLPFRYKKQLPLGSAYVYRQKYTREAHRFTGSNQEYRQIDYCLFARKLDWHVIYEYVTLNTKELKLGLIRDMATSTVT